ncbi:glycosyltransferase family 2 protein, partial [Escherichia coli]
MQYQSDRVSIIIISYNHEQFIEKAIESVLFQTYKDIELIIVDNNSSDNTREILNQYKDVYN